MHLALALAIVLGVFVQVYLIGAYIFGAGQGALDAHETAGFDLQGLEMLVFVAALDRLAAPGRPRSSRSCSRSIGNGAGALASAHHWVGGLHPLLALVVLSLAATLALRGLRRHRRPAQRHCGVWTSSPDRPGPSQSQRFGSRQSPAINSAGLFNRRE